MSQEQNARIAGALIAALGACASADEIAVLFSTDVQIEIDGDVGALPGIGRKAARRAVADFVRNTRELRFTSMVGSTELAAVVTACSVVSATSGTNVGIEDATGSQDSVLRSLLASRRHVKTCCEQSCQRPRRKLTGQASRRRFAPSRQPTNGAADQVPSVSRADGNRHSRHR